MLKRLLLASVLLGAGVLLFYGGTQAMRWTLARPDVQARRSKIVVSPTPSAPAPSQMHTATASPATTRPATISPTKTAAPIAVDSSPTARPVEHAEPADAPAATYTPMPTFTPAPTASSIPPTPVSPASTPQRVAAPTTASVVAPTLIEPPANETLRGRVTFRWQPVALPPGAAYEVVWWRKDADPNTARGLAQPSTSPSQSIDLSGLGLPTGQSLYWSVLIVNASPSYQRLLTPQASNGRPFMFQNSDDRSSAGEGKP